MRAAFIIPLFVFFSLESKANNYGCDLFWSTERAHSETAISPEIRLQDIYAYSTLLREQHNFNRHLRQSDQAVRDFLNGHDIHTLQVVLTGSREMPVSERYPYLRLVAPALWRTLRDQTAGHNRNLEHLQTRLNRIQSLLDSKLAALGKTNNQNFRQRSAVAILLGHQRVLKRKLRLLDAARLPLSLILEMVEHVYEHQFDDRLGELADHDPAFLVWAYLLLFQGHPQRNHLREMHRFWPRVLSFESTQRRPSWTEKIHPFRWELSSSQRSHLKLEP